MYYSVSSWKSCCEPPNLAITIFTCSGLDDSHTGGRPSLSLWSLPQGHGFYFLTNNGSHSRRPTLLFSKRRLFTPESEPQRLPQSSSEVRGSSLVPTTDCLSSHFPFSPSAESPSRSNNQNIACRHSVRQLTMQVSLNASQNKWFG